MATHRIPILGWATLPDSSGSVWFEPLAVLATNDVWPELVAVFADTATRIGLGGRFTAPKNYVGTPKFVIVWSTTATSGNAIWDVDYRAVGADNSESLDQTGNQESLSVTDAAPGAAWRRMECLIAATAANFAVDDEVQFTLFRDGADSDTIAASIVLFQLLFEYADA